MSRIIREWPTLTLSAALWLDEGARAVLPVSHPSPALSLSTPKTSRRAPLATRTDGGPDIANQGRNRAAPAQQAGRASACVRDTNSLSLVNNNNVLVSIVPTPLTSANIIKKSSSTGLSVAAPPAYDSIFPPSPPLSASSAASSPSESFFSTLKRTNSGGYVGVTAKSHAAPALLSSPVSSVCGSNANSFDAAFGLSTPPASPARSSFGGVRHLSLLEQVFAPTASIHNLPSSEVQLDDLLGSGWTGSVVENPIAGTRTLYLAGKVLSDVELRDSIVQVVERAEEEYGCDALVLALNKKTEGLGDLLHQLMYVGCTVVSNHDNTGEPNDDYLLLGMEL
ncbi:hypothetical protein JCM10908_007234 [Rhodotorula pacifica]|uniref:uncharacterized protein n=1 Tax=Rhodotorula pacifica TaxID=1495444 RepID=UPI003170E28C